MLSRQIAAAYLRMLDFPHLVLAALAVLVAVAALYTTRFSFDASSDTLVVEGDPDLATYLAVTETFGSDQFLLMTFSPHAGDALDVSNLAVIDQLSQRLSTITGVANVFSILDAPLLKSPPVALADMAEGFRTLRSEGVDLRLARAELSGSPLFSELLITVDGLSTAMRIDLAPDDALLAVEAERSRLLALTDPGPEELLQLRNAGTRHRLAREHYLSERDRLIEDVRRVQSDFQSKGTLHLGGVPMIAADMIAFVKADLVVFGSSVLALVVLGLYVFFRSWRWVVLPVVGSIVTVLFTTGVLGYAVKPATVVSSNFISLLAIITISLNIHLIVRYRELVHLEPDADSVRLVKETMMSKFAPCLYNAATTMVAFGSLMASSIVPVEDFGWMMVLGIALGFAVTFSFFPAALSLLSARIPGTRLNHELGFTRLLSHNARWRPGWVTGVSVGLAGVAALGISQVSLDNRFIDYFDEDTEISRGMRFIDEHLGGTVPFDVVVTVAPYGVAGERTGEEDAFLEEDAFFEEDDFFEGADDFSGSDPYPERYWFTRDKLDRVEEIQRYIESRPEVGKTLSLATLETLATEFTDGKRLSALEIVGVLGALPAHLRPELIDPYASPKSGQLRLTARVIESGPQIDRDQLIEDIRSYVTNQAGFAEENVQITGMMVLFNSMLNQLFSSQVDTLMYVLLATFLMFVVLMRSFLYAVLGLLPNVLAAALVIAFMGYAGIPLDMMTITIAAISVGIGVDDAIHYLHRFKEEFVRTGDARVAVAFSHATIGRAMYYTSLTIILGFSVLAFSNFVPTVLFGLLTALAMVLALVANLTLLPSLLVLCRGGGKPYRSAQT